MKALIFSLFVMTAGSAFAAHTLNDKIVSLLPVGTHTGEECGVIVKKAGSALSINVNDERDSVDMVLDSSAEGSVVIKDRSTESTIDVIARRHVVSEYSISIATRRLQISGNVVKLSEVKFGITGQLNTLKTIECGI